MRHGQSGSRGHYPGGSGRRFGAAAGRLACALAFAALLALALAWSLHPLVHDDLFWHLRSGEWIAAHHRVPLVDLFSYTRPGARWITHEWGFSLASWLLYRAGGMGGLVATTALLALAIFAAIGWRAVDLAGAAAPAAPAEPRRPAAAPGSRDDAPPREGATARCLLLAALLALGLWAASPEIFLRAALAGELMLALVLAALGRYRRTGRRRWLAALAALFWPWANLHSGVVFGLFVLALYALEPFVGPAPRASPASPGSPAPSAPPASPASPRGGLGRRLAAAAPLLWTLAAASALTLLNPNGLDGPLYPFLLARILYASGIPWELGHFSATAATGGAADAALWLLLVLLLLALLPLRQARRLSPAEAASIAAFFVLTLVSHRFVFDLVVIALPTLYKLLVLPPPAPPAATPRRVAGGLHGLAGRPALAAVAVALFLLPVGAAAIAAAAAGWARRPPAGGGLIAEPFPQAAARFVAGQRLATPGDRLFNHQNWGGFIGWRLHVPVFWDGRNDVFAELVREVATHPFGLTASRHRLDWLLIAEHDYPGIQPEIAAGRWGLVYWDDFCAVYLRRGPRYAEPLSRLEIRLFPPFGGRPGLSTLAANPGRAAAARAELARLLAANPENQRARYFQAMISLYQGDLRRATADLQAASRIRPNDQINQVLLWLHNLPTKPAGGRNAM